MQSQRICYNDFCSDDFFNLKATFGDTSRFKRMKNVLSKISRLTTKLLVELHLQLFWGSLRRTCIPRAGAIYHSLWHGGQQKKTAPANTKKAMGTWRFCDEVQDLFEPQALAPERAKRRERMGGGASWTGAPSLYLCPSFLCHRLFPYSLGGGLQIPEQLSDCTDKISRIGGKFRRQGNWSSQRNVRSFFRPVKHWPIIGRKDRLILKWHPKENGSWATASSTLQDFVRQKMAPQFLPFSSCMQRHLSVFRVSHSAELEVWSHFWYLSGKIRFLTFCDVIVCILISIIPQHQLLITVLCNIDFLPLARYPAQWPLRAASKGPARICCRLKDAKRRKKKTKKVQLLNLSLKSSQMIMDWNWNIDFNRLEFETD